MRELKINELTQGSKLMNILRKSLPEAKDSFFYKMLRKKNITLNSKKATGSEIVSEGDVIKFFLSEETYDKFAGRSRKSTEKETGDTSESMNDGICLNGECIFENGKYSEIKTELNVKSSEEKGKTGFKNAPTKESEKRHFQINKKDIIYEDRDIILINKPYGVLSQKADESDYSMVEALYDYMSDTGQLSQDDIFRPAVTNRLDRNTTGIIAGGKTTSGLRYLSNAQKKGSVKKYYICIVAGEMKDTRLLNGLWSKNTRNNKVTIDMVENIPNSYSFPSKYWIKGNVPVQTLVAPVITNGRYTVVKIGLLTGKSHQIRAHMKSYGFPLIGDYKYGQKSVNDYFTAKYGLKSQLLHAYVMNIEGMGEYVAELPEQFIKILKGEGLYSDSMEELYVNTELKP